MSTRENIRLIARAPCPDSYSPEALCCVLEQDTLSSQALLSSGSTLKDRKLFSGM